MDPRCWRERDPTHQVPPRTRATQTGSEVGDGASRGSVVLGHPTDFGPAVGTGDVIGLFVAIVGRRRARGRREDAARASGRRPIAGGGRRRPRRRRAQELAQGTRKPAGVSSDGLASTSVRHGWKRLLAVHRAVGSRLPHGRPDSCLDVGAPFEDAPSSLTLSGGPSCVLRVSRGCSRSLAPPLSSLAVSSSTSGSSSSRRRSAEIALFGSTALLRLLFAFAAPFAR
jgi:hypothetical protein